MTARNKPAHWQWVVLCSTFMINLIIEYYAYLFSILKPHIEAEYVAARWSPEAARSTVSAMGAIIPTLCLVLAPVGSAFVYTIGCRNLAIIASVFPAICLLLCWLLNDIFAITGLARVIIDVIGISLSTGLAAGALYGPSIASIQEYFAPQQRGFATGVVVCAGPASALVLGGISYQLSLIYSWRGVFLIAGGFALNGVAAGFAYDHPQKPTHISRKELILQSFGFDLFRVWHFYCAIISSALGIVSYIAILLLMSQASVPEHNVSDSARSILLVLFGISNLIGRFTCGVIADQGHKHALLTAFSIYLFGTLGCAVTIMTFASFGVKFGDAGFIAFAVLYGICIAPLTVLRSVIMESLYGMDRLNASFGWLLMAQGTVFLIAFPFTDWLDSIDITFSGLFTSGCLVISGLFMSFIYRPYFAERRRRIQSSIDIGDKVERVVASE